MTLLVKTLKAGELPDGWRSELGLEADRQVRVAIDEVRPTPTPEEVKRLLEELNQLFPVTIDTDVTAFIRAERARIDGRDVDPGR
jgi:hypothetical protein